MGDFKYISSACNYDYWTGTGYQDGDLYRNWTFSCDGNQYVGGKSSWYDYNNGFGIAVISGSVVFIAPTITGTPAATVVAGSAYSFTPTATYTDIFSIANLPSWASFDTSTGALTGIPTIANVGTYSNIQITATNVSGSVSLPAFSITVNPPAPTISGTPATTDIAGSLYTFTPTATNAASFSITNMPSWANFNTSSGALTGTPTNVNAGIYSNIVITDTNITGSASLSAFTITVTAVPADGICGNANGGTSDNKPVNNLCNLGNPSIVTGTGSWTWTCSGQYGGNSANCSANIQTYDAYSHKSWNR